MSQTMQDWCGWLLFYKRQRAKVFSVLPATPISPGSSGSSHRREMPFHFCAFQSTENLWAVNRDCTGELHGGCYILFLKWNLKEFFALTCTDTLQVVPISHLVSREVLCWQPLPGSWLYSTTQEILPSYNFKTKKGRLGSCVFGEMWKHKFAEARICVSNEMN